MLDRMIVLNADALRGFISTTDCLLFVFKNLCPHCKVLSAVIEKCLPAFPGLILAGVNSEENPASLVELGVSKVPTVLIYRHGVVAARRSGVMKPGELSDLIAKAQAE